jgi:hypothetical protein
MPLRKSRSCDYPRSQTRASGTLAVAPAGRAHRATRLAGLRVGESPAEAAGLHEQPERAVEAFCSQ